jgi:ParB-like chromosome segregation protein Spo0J
MNDQTKPKLELKLAPLATLADLDVQGLKPHPIADEDPLMNAAEFEALKVSIKASGIREPITLFREKDTLQILDGRNRYNAAKKIDHRWGVENFRMFNGTVDEARRFAAELNDIRRHLSMDQRKAKAQRLIKENPGLSSRALATKCGVSHTLIAEMRKEVSDDEKRYSAFARAWAALSLTAQERFVREYRIDLSELLRGAT